MSFMVGTRTHEVDYEKWCPTCKHKDEKESCDACNDCLNQPWNIDSRKPINWTEGEMSNET